MIWCQEDTCYYQTLATIEFHSFEVPSEDSVKENAKSFVFYEENTEMWVSIIMQNTGKHWGQDVGQWQSVL